MRALAMIFAVMLVATGCAGNPSSPTNVVECTDPRPQVCTMEYDPVCANLIKGERRQYSSGCNACADDNVASYLPDTCPVEEGENS